MENKNDSKTALFSLNDTSRAVEFAQRLTDFNWRIVTTTETSELLEKSGIKSVDIKDFTGIYHNYGIPPTLHPKIEQALAGNGAEQIDLVYDIPYPLEKGNDVGGHTLLALAAKGSKIAVFNHADMEKVLDELGRSPGHASISDALRRGLVGKVHRHIIEHYRLVAAESSGNDEFDDISGSYACDLANGENPYQQPASLFKTSDDPLGLPFVKNFSITKPCFTNLADIDSLIYTLCLISEAFHKHYQKIPYISVAAKHGNPCGLAVDWEYPFRTVEPALFGNPLAVWGGEFVTNYKISKDIAGQLIESSRRKDIFGKKQWLLDVVLAPDYDTGAIDLLTMKDTAKVLKNNALFEPGLSNEQWHYRRVRGGFLRQPGADYILSPENMGWNSSPLKDDVLDSLIIAWAVAFTSFHGGNEIAIAKNRSLIGSGGGPSTADAAKTAVLRAKEANHDLDGSIFAADAFFPFTDAPDTLIGCGCKAGVCPSGGKNEALVHQLFKETGITVAYLDSEIRGFCRH
jgi:phosphoribosylaminoimidazolecarboxamide formyltransferase/IMP cyclohydrolase